MCRWGKQHKTPDHQNNMKITLSLFVLFWIFLIAIIAIYSPSREEQEVMNLKYDNCVAKMQKAIPDPNDTEARSIYLETCYED